MALLLPQPRPDGDIFIEFTRGHFQRVATANFSVIESWIFVAYSSYTASCDQFDGKIIVRAMCDILRARSGCGAKFSDSIENS
jgi:hypothetical protein